MVRPGVIVWCALTFLGFPPTERSNGMTDGPEGPLHQFVGFETRVYSTGARNASESD